MSEIRDSVKKRSDHHQLLVVSLDLSFAEVLFKETVTIRYRAVKEDYKVKELVDFTLVVSCEGLLFLCYLLVDWKGGQRLGCEVWILKRVRFLQIVNIARENI